MSAFHIFLILNGFFALITLLPLWRFEAWWVRSLDFPRIQFFVFGVALLILELFVLDGSLPSTWSLLATSLVFLIFQAWWIIPYTPFYPVEVKTTDKTETKNSLKIITANVLTPNRSADKLIRLIQKNKPDIFVTLESDAWWQAKLDTLEGEYSHTIKCPLDNLYGMHVYSKLPLSESRIEYLEEPDVPSIHTLITIPSGDKIRAHFLHPAPPSPTENAESSERDAELIAVAKIVSESNLPVIVTGDLNDVAWSATTRLFRKISGLLDPRIGRGVYNTFNAFYWFMRWPLDHLFHSNHFTLTEIRKLPGFDSDHFALLTQLNFEGDRKIEQKGLDSNTEDQSWAEEKLKGQEVSENDVPTPGE